VRRAHRLISPRLRRALDSEDLAQEALGSTAGRSSLVFGSVAAVRGYLLRALRNAAAHHGRRARSAALDEADGLRLPAREGSPSAIAADREQVSGLERHLRALGEREREVVRLRHAEDLAFAAIAERLGLSESNARQIYNRALHKLRADGVGREGA
jgi:RNA polymerase sigma factor (sigma-70 family)